MSGQRKYEKHIINHTRVQPLNIELKRADSSILSINEIIALNNN